MWLTLVRIGLGVDMALGFYNYAAWSWLAGYRFNVCFLMLSLLSTHLPDADMIPYLLVRKRYRLTSHWVLGHHALLVVPLVTVASFAAARIWIPAQAGYAAALMTCGVLLHFIHDGVGQLGFPWLSPFSRTYFRLRAGRFSIVSQSELEYWKRHWMSCERTAGAEISDRARPITPAHLLFWCTGGLLVLLTLR